MSARVHRATDNRTGCFEGAHRQHFLDEINSTTPHLQVNCFAL
jgi:hypothetical protein